MAGTSAMRYNDQHCHQQDRNQIKRRKKLHQKIPFVRIVIATALAIISLLGSSWLPSFSVDAAFASAAATSIKIRGGSTAKTTTIPSSLMAQQNNQLFGRNNNVRPNTITSNTFNNNPTVTKSPITKFRGGALSFSPSPTVFDNAPFFQSSIIFLLLNILGLIISVVSGGSHVHLDLIGSGAFAAAALPTLISSSAGGLEMVTSRVSLSSASVMVWGTKLALFLFWRATKVKTDGRLEETLSTFSGTVIFWLISAVWGILTSLPHTLGTTSSSPGNPIFLTVGFSLYLSGLTIESLADYQKWIFKQQNPSSFCNVGLWSISQHPNFFGNLLLWLGIFIMNAPALIGNFEEGSSILEVIKASWRLPLACLSPLFLWSLFSSQVNGEMTNAVEVAKSKYGNDPAFMEYIENVPKIIPNLFRLWKKN